MAIVASKLSVSMSAARAAWPSVGRIVAGLLVALSAHAFAAAQQQQYQADPVDEKLRAQVFFAEGVIKNPATYSTEKEKFLTFFGTYYLPAMTRYTSNDLATLGKLRYELFSKFLWPSSNADQQRDLTNLAFEKMSPIVMSRNYHPAVRYNAILVVGQLDEQYPIDQGANRRPSKPYKKSNELLLKIVDAATKGLAVDPALLVGALVGLERHAQFKDLLDRPTVDAMSASLLKLVQLEPLLPNADRQVAQWVRLQAATALANLGSPGAKGEVVAALSKLVENNSEPKLPLDTRCQIAALLAKLNYQGATIDGKAAATTVLNLTSEVAKEEATEAKNFEQLHIGGYNQDGPRPKLRAKFTQYGGTPEYERRTMLARLGDVRRALEATRPAVSPEDQAKYDAILAAIRPAVDAAANKDVVDLEVARKINVMAAEIQNTINPSAAPAAVDDTDIF